MKNNRGILNETGRRALRVLFALLLVLSAVLPAQAADRAGTWEEVRDVILEAIREGRTEASFSLSAELMEEYNRDDSILEYWMKRGGAEKYSWSWNSRGDFEVSELQPFDCLWFTASDEAEFALYVGYMRDHGEERFVALPSKELYEALTDDKRGLEICLRGGLKGYEGLYTSSELQLLDYRGCTYWRGGLARASTEAEFLSALEELYQAGWDAVALSLDAELWDRLMTGDGMRFQTLAAYAGLESGYSTYTDNHIVMWRGEGESVFYPAYVILRAVSAGREEQLAPRLQQTLAEARRMISGISGTAKEMALAIHDLLCAHVTYTIDETTEDDDRCIGAILDGRANCDGYADAYALLCGLKGIPVRLQIGDSRFFRTQLDEGSHMWNLICLDGSWRFTDVTFDDTEGDISWVYWNFGKDRIRENYTCLKDLLPGNMLDETDLLDRPVPEFRVGNAEEVAAAAKTTRSLGKNAMVLWMNEGLFRQFEGKDNPIFDWLRKGGVRGCSVSYSSEDMRVHVVDLEWK